MTLAERRARETAERFGRDPERVAAALGLISARDALPGGHREVYFDRAGQAGVIVDRSLDRVESRAMLAHGIAHHLLHAGNRVSGTSRAIWSGRHEREAEDFAACLLVPGETLGAWREALDPQPLAVLAAELAVPNELVRRRLGMLAAQLAA